MNQALTEQIAKHILTGLGVIPSHNVHQSLIDKEFLLEQKLHFKNEGASIVKNSIYACQITIDQKDFKIILGDCSQEKGFPEYCLVIQFKGNPAYGLYFILESHDSDGEALIAVSVNDKDWMPCNTFLQATFLSAMEQLKDLGIGWIKCSNYKKEYDMLLSMINFHSAYEVENEG